MIVSHLIDHGFMDLGYQDFGKCPVMSGSIVGVEIV